MDHDEKPPAPGRLGLVQAFVNSLDYPHGPDELADPQTAERWIRAQGIPLESPLTARECNRLQTARERLRDVLQAHTGRDVSAQERANLARSLQTAPLNVVPDEDGWHLAPAARGADAVLARIAAAMAEASVLGTWRRLKVCVADSCRFAFYDNSKNGCGSWCSMKVCGARAKSRAYRARRRDTSRSPVAPATAG